MSLQDSEVPTRNNAPKTPWGKPFEKGNPGRPKGARNKLGEAFIEALHASFEKDGKSAIDRVIADEPAQYLRVIASLMPKQLELKETTFSELSDADLAYFLDTIRRLREAPSIGTVIEGVAEQVGDVQAISETESVP